MSQKQKWIGIGLGAVCLLVGLVYWLIPSNKESILIKKGPLVEAVYALGSVQPENIYSLKLGISASIRELYIEEGQSVAKGAPLIRVDSGLIFKAPFAGTIANLTLSKDEIAMPGVPILELIDMRNLYVQVSLDQESALRVRPKQKVQLSFESIRGHNYVGEVERIYPSQGQFLVKIITPNLPEGILPAMTTDVAIEVSKRENVVLVPLVGVDKGKVIRIRNGKRQKIEIKLGAINSEFGELLSGDLQDGDEVFVNQK
ncbi:MAG: HlyD family efflux transporter periplasmic adaptor subunit [Leptospira sp.]|nr:HlyD family efflux transporter periplasmic adaptor subunit [Leptospira sp.]